MQILNTCKEQWWYIMLKLVLELPSNLFVLWLSNLLPSLCSDSDVICIIKKIKVSSKCAVEDVPCLSDIKASPNCAFDVDVPCLREIKAASSKCVGEDVPYLSNDFISEILGKLPMKSLCRFKCVSKQWEGLIMHLLSDRQCVGPLSALLLFTVVNERPDMTKFACVPISSSNKRCKLLESDLDDSLHSLDVVQSCNGLLLCRTDFMEPHPNYFIFNTTTMESVALPLPRIGRPYAYCCLAFDPKISPHYKVVRFFGNYSSGPKDPVEFEIYSSLTGEWVQQTIQTIPKTYTNSSQTPVLHKGVLYWLCSEGIVRFDIEKPSSRFCLCQWAYADGASPDPDHRIQYLRVSRGRLYAVSYDHVLDCLEECVYYIWILEEGQCPIKWVLKHIINQKTFDNNLLPCDGMKLTGTFDILAFHPDSEVIYLGFDHEIVSYEAVTERLEVVYRDFSGHSNMWSFLAFTISHLPWNPLVLG